MAVHPVARADEACARVLAPHDLGPGWASALEDLRRQIAMLPASDCRPMTLSVEPAGSAARVVAVTVDGHVAERRVDWPESLVATALGLLVAIPEAPSLPASQVPASRTFQASQGVSPDVGRPPRTLAAWVGFAAGARLTAPTAIAVLDVEARADLWVDRWLMLATIRSAVAGCQGQQGLDCDVYNDVSAGVGLGRRLPAGTAEVDLGFEPSIVWMHMEYDEPVGETQSVAGNEVELRLDASARLAVPFGDGWWLTFTLEAGLAPSLLTTTRLEQPASATPADGEPPPFPAWAGGVRLGASRALP